ncbi:MAG: bile acid:sodium symporter family protein [Patescibacteria group bacterium]|nr:bile acid:sodium symporter family protein [Patescibacteria group bacterium]
MIRSLHVSRVLLAMVPLGLMAGLGLWLAGQTALAGGAVVAAVAALALAVAASARFRSLAFTAWVFAFVTSALFFPDWYTWQWRGWEPKHAILPLVQVIMFGMGVTLSFADFGRILKMPKAVLLGVVCQYTIMPLMAWIFAGLFGLSGEVAAGLVLIGSCPGGVASNVIVFIARANVALSVTMTACSTVLSPLATPLAMKLIAGQYVPIEAAPMMASILKMILVPVLLGLLTNHFAHKLVARLVRVLPFVAMLGICLIIAITIALARDELLAVGLALFGAAACHNAAGYALGYGCARAAGLDRRDSRTVAIEVGIQNGGMATGLALNVLKSPAAALGSAVFGPWSAVTSSVLASYWRRSVSRTGSPARIIHDR